MRGLIEKNEARDTLLIYMWTRILYANAVSLCLIKDFLLNFVFGCKNFLHFCVQYKSDRFNIDKRNRKYKHTSPKSSSNTREHIYFYASQLSSSLHDQTSTCDYTSTLQRTPVTWQPRRSSRVNSKTRCRRLKNPRRWKDWPAALLLFFLHKRKYRNDNIRCIRLLVTLKLAVSVIVPLAWKL